ncbi:MAG: hypothetical protein PWP24_970 [Clostridiales bacterium]|nr:hypothetical protein [Clostridiales bacterium]
MTIRHMKIFIEVYQTENITQAASHLNMTQPAVSRAIQEIENYYGVCLFERMNRRLFVTESGRQFYSKALHIIDTFKIMEAELYNWEKEGSLRIGASITIGNAVLPEIICKFQTVYPNIRLQVTISNGESLQNKLLDNQLDFAFLEGTVSKSDLQAQILSAGRLVLVMPKGHELEKKRDIQIKDLEPYELLLREKGSAGRDFLESVFEESGIVLSPLWESASTQAIIKAVHLGIGISILPERLISKYIQEGYVISKTIEEPSFFRNWNVVYHKNKYLTSAAKSFLGQMKEALAAEAK